MCTVDHGHGEAMSHLSEGYTINWFERRTVPLTRWNKGGLAVVDTLRVCTCGRILSGETRPCVSFVPRPAEMGPVVPIAV